MKDYKDYFIEGVSFLEEAENSVKNPKDEGFNFYLIQTSVEKFLKAIMSYYGIKFPEQDYIDVLIEKIEEETTIRFPDFKDELLELAFVPYEGGCASSTVYEKRPESFLNAVKQLKEFVLDEIPVF